MVKIAHTHVAMCLVVFGVLFSTVILLQSGLPLTFAASAPNILPYQGRILNDNGVPIADATANMQFRLYDSLTVGTCLWSNDASDCSTDDDQVVTLTDGLFSEYLGDTGEGYAAILDTVFADNATVFLEVEINGEVLTPRKQIGAAAYALNADTLDGLDESAFLDIAATNDPLTGVLTAANGDGTTPGLNFTGDTSAGIRWGAGPDTFNALIIDGGTTDTTVDVTADFFQVFRDSGDPVIATSVGGPSNSSVTIGNATNTTALTMTGGVFTIANSAFTNAVSMSQDAGGFYIQQDGSTAATRPIRVQAQASPAVYSQFFVDPINGFSFMINASGANGNVGIGTQTPDTALEILGSQDTEIIRLTDGDALDSVGIFMGDGTVGLDGALSAQAGSIFLDQDGKLWVNIDGATDWQDLTVAAAASTLQAAYDADANGGDVTVTTNATDGDIVFAGDQDFRVTTTGNSIFDTSTLVVDATNNRIGIGDATPDHFVDIEAGSLASTISALNVSGTLSSTVASQVGINYSITGAGSGANVIVGLQSFLNGGFSGSDSSFGGYFANVSTGTATNGFLSFGSGVGGGGNFGAEFVASGVTAGHNIGSMSYAIGSSVLNIGGVGQATSTSGTPARQVGLFGSGRQGSSVNVGVWATNYNENAGASAVSALTSAALLVDNADATNPIIVARDNGTTVFTIADGGTTTLTGSFLPGTNDTFNLGSDSLRWADLFLGPGTLHIGTADADDYEFSYDTTNNALIFNEDGDDVDVRIESDGDANMFFVDAGLSRIGVGDATPSATLDISVASATVDGTKGVRISNPGGTIAQFEVGNADDSYIGTTGGSDFNIRTNNLVRMNFDNGGNIGVGDASPAALFTVGDGDDFQVSSTGLLTSPADTSWTITGDIDFALTGGIDAFTVDGTTFNVDEDNNRIGFGTAAPSATLDVSVASAAADGTKGVRISNPGGTVAQFEVGNANDSYIGTSSASSFNIRSNNLVRVEFDTNGNTNFDSGTLFVEGGTNRVGFGDITPEHVLDIEAGTLATTVSGLGVTGTIANPGTTFENLVSINASTAGTSNSGQVGLHLTMGAGFTGARSTFGALVVNSVAGTASTGVFGTNGNIGLEAQALGTSSTASVGLAGYAEGSTGFNVGALTQAYVSGSGVNIGNLSTASNGSGVEVAGFFMLRDGSAGNPSIASSAAFMADNGSFAEDIIVARDNGTEVFSIEDGGNIAATGLFRGGDGSATTPTYSWTSDTGIGMYRRSSGSIGIDATQMVLLTADATPLASSDFEVQKSEAGSATVLGVANNASTGNAEFLAYGGTSSSGASARFTAIGPGGSFNNLSAGTVAFLGSSFGSVLTSVQMLTGETAAPLVFGFNNYISTSREFLRMTDGTAGAVFNEDSLDRDFRVETDNNAGGFFVDASTDDISFNTDGDATTDVIIQGDTDANLFLADASADVIGIGTASPSAKLSLEVAQPASVSSATGTAATDMFSIIGGIGGDTTIASTGTGGEGSDVSMTTGDGGVAGSATTQSTGGSGGDYVLTGGFGGDADVTGGIKTGGVGGSFNFTSGPGGATTGTGTSNTGGEGGHITLDASDGGNASGATANTGGAGGEIIIQSGDGGTGATAGGVGGNITVLAGSGSGDANGGDILLVPGSAGGAGIAGIVDIAGELQLTLAEGASGEAVCGQTDGGGADEVLESCGAAPAADYMEIYAVSEDVVMGTLVAPGTDLVTSTKGHTFAKLVPTTQPYQSTMMGIASDPDDAGDFNSIGYNIQDTDNPQPIALKGRVLVRMNLENGPIEVGDPITSSSTSGEGMRASDAGQMIGYALEPYTSTSSDNMVMVFLSLGYYPGDGSTNPTAGTDNQASEFGSGGATNFTALNMSGNIFMQGNQIVEIGRLAGMGGVWSIEEDGTMITHGLVKTVIESYQGEEVETVAVTSPDVQITLVGSSELVNGEAVVVFEDVRAEYNDIIDTASPVRVVVTPNGPVSLYVTEKSRNGFTVRELGGASTGVTFDWMVSAFRKDYAPVIAEAPPTPVDPPAEEVTPEPAPEEPPPSPEVSGDQQAESEPPAEEPVVDEPVVEEPPAEEPPAEEIPVSEPAPEELIL